ncbi:glycosyltransferase family 4 protein [Bradyrhizobium quebecense]|uniref:Glycosyltransferase family 4 protein n=2 Tax=Bradyrhizobium quebecense TaxID=2748629 RepID=A0ACD3VLL5_9BRAD|nr:glycosyltransferase family 4 protein [Bradyrhizobium quebecense]UGY06977.1 glycosyltransferase family 4 protein [Bradyrhizobium quebecense]
MFKQISSFIKRCPPLFRALRPGVYFFFRVRNALIARFAIFRAWLAHARFPRMQDVGEATSQNRRIGRSASGREVVMLVVSDLRVDSRVEREARALAAAGYDVTVICPEPSKGVGISFNLDWGPRVHIEYADWTAATFMNEQPGYLADQLYWGAVKRKPFAFHAHDLSTAYAAMAAAKYRGAHLVVDFHEWFSENVHWNTKQSAWAPYPAEWKRALQELEVRCLNEASATITVCDSIADTMEAELGGRRPVVVRNIPDIAVTPSREYPPLKRQLGLPDSTFVLLWQGGTGPTRLIEPIIEALAYAPDCIFVIRGPSLDLFGPDYLALARRTGVEGRLVLAPPVPSKDVVAAARGADAGIWTLPALCRNFTFALPNKIFEYLAADLPVLVAHYPEAKRLVMENEVGLTFDPYDPRSIAESINRLVQDEQLRAAFVASTRKTLAMLDAKSEWQKVVSVYDSLRARKSSHHGSTQ